MAAREQEPARQTKGTWGGWRLGAGARPGRTRPFPTRAGGHLDFDQPIRVRLDFAKDVPSLLAPRQRAVIDGVLREAPPVEGFELVGYRVETDRVRLSVRARDARTLRSGMSSLSVRTSRRLNRALGRSGAALRDRYRIEATPDAEVRRSARGRRS